MKTQIDHAKMLVLQILTVLLSLPSCNQNEMIQPSTTADRSVAGFNFENRIETNLSLTFRDFSANAVDGINLKLYFENPYKIEGMLLNPNIQPSIKGVTDENGSFSTILPMAGHIDTLYVLVDNFMYQECYKFPKANNIREVIYPKGFGVLPNISTRAAGDPIAYTRASVLWDSDPQHAILGNESNFYVLSTYNSTNGQPATLIGTPANIDPVLLAKRLAGALPPGVNQIALNGTTGYFNSTQFHVLPITDPAGVQVKVTFLSEGAALRNTLGYFWYPTGSTPASVSQISKRVIIFPNASSVNDSQNSALDALQTGNTMKLMYYNGTSWTDIFPQNVTVGFFLVSAGWSDGYWAYNLPKWNYSLFTLNSGSSPQSLILYDKYEKKLVLCFEDVWCNSGNSDKDFNDMVFMLNTNPEQKTLQATYPPLLANTTGGATPPDADADGVIDQYDDFPSDNTRAHRNYYPESGNWGSFAFEDNWPEEGDYDFNDLVMDYQIEYVTNSTGDVKDLILRSKVRAIGANNKNGFAWEIPSLKSINATTQIQSITSVSGPTGLLGGNIFPVTNGYETGQTNIVIPFFDNAFRVWGFDFIEGYPNTVSGTQYAPVTIEKKITFTTHVTKASLGSMPFNPFIIVGEERGREVHKAGQPCTNKATVSYFGQGADRSNQTTKWYVGTTVAPWVIDTPTPFDYPKSGTRITTAYLKMLDWINTNGAIDTDWYHYDLPGYRNSGYIFK